MTTIYAVNAGKYSDYKIVALFSSKELAEEYMEAFPINDWNSYNPVEEFPLDPNTVDLAKKGYLHCRILMLRDGTVEQATSEKLNTNNFNYTQSWVWRRVNAPAFAGQNVQNCLVCCVIAKDEKHAIKIANERRTQMIANGEWD